jgi:predicted RNA-binding Zn-ribbon protein involved in translation (DUF1610 family)
VHEGEQSYACDQCDKRFARGVAMRQHIRYVHEGVRELPCPECGKMFGRPHNLRKHLRGVHKHLGAAAATGAGQSKGVAKTGGTKKNKKLEENVVNNETEDIENQKDGESVLS